MYGTASPDAHVNAGGLAAIMQAFDVSRQAASAAYSIVQCILRPGSMSPKVMTLNSALVARMDGVHRCCHLLCPVFLPQEAVEASLGEHFFCCLTAFHEAKCLFADAHRRDKSMQAMHAQSHVVLYIYVTVSWVRQHAVEAACS